jgi:hypothetical protein
MVSAPGDDWVLPAHQDHETAFLIEMVVAGQYLSDAVIVHGVHGDAIYQTVALVQSVAVKLEAFGECFGALRNDCNIGVSQNLINHLECNVASMSISRHASQNEVSANACGIIPP